MVAVRGEQWTLPLENLLSWHALAMLPPPSPWSGAGGFFGCMTQFGQRLYFSRRVFSATVLSCRSLGSRVERRGVEERADGTLLLGYQVVLEIATCRAHAQSLPWSIMDTEEPSAWPSTWVEAH